MQTPKSSSRFRMVSTLTETYGLSPAIATVFSCCLLGIILLAVAWFVRSAPPRTLSISSGPQGSSYERIAEAYQKRLAEHGVTLNIVPSAGSQANLKQLTTPGSGIDIGFVQGGPSEGVKLDDLVSLGSVAYQPLWLFYRSATPISRLSELEGKMICVGDEGSGTRVLATALLQANSLNKDTTRYLSLNAEQASASLLEGKVDAIFLMGDSASSQVLRSLVRTPQIHLYNFTQADAYVRRYAYLNKITLPEGSFDFGRNLPSEDLVLVGPTVELVVRKDLNPTISDLLLEIAQEVHGKASLLQKRGEFPTPLEHEIKISEDAQRFYKSGKSFLNRAVGSFWLASIINRVLVVFVPLIVVLIPVIRFFPTAFKLSIRLKFFHYYRRLLRLEKEALVPMPPERIETLLAQVQEIEESVHNLKVPASLGDAYYGLRSHIILVREKLRSKAVA